MLGTWRNHRHGNFVFDRTGGVRARRSRCCYFQWFLAGIVMHSRHYWNSAGQRADLRLTLTVTWTLSASLWHGLSARIWFSNGFRRGDGSPLAGRAMWWASGDIGNHSSGIVERRSEPPSTIGRKRGNGTFNFVWFIIAATASAH